MKKFSIIIPVYYNELNLPDTIPQLLTLSESFPDFVLELVFVDDGSGDNSLNILLDFQSQYPKIIKVVKLTRNFGAMAAVQAGMTIATGNCVGVIAADLQDPPQLFNEMIDHWEKGAKAVFATRADREESFLQKFFSNLHYALVRRLAIPQYPSGGFDFFLVDRQVVEELNRIHEKNTNIMTLIFWLGFQPTLVSYTRQSRKKGKSRWTLGKRVKLFVDTFVAFSYFPIQILSALGFLVAFGAFLYGAIIFITWMFYGIEVMGWVPTMIVLTFTAGIQMTMLGILGEYLWRTLDETRSRPHFVIDEVIDDALKTEEKK
ncbi:MAG: glycosyltransferase [Chloroflexi bacterium]|nr:glycosyltransferase [Chloroflexota bacterium]